MKIKSLVYHHRLATTWAGKTAALKTRQQIKFIKNK